MSAVRVGTPALLGTRLAFDGHRVFLQKIEKMSLFFAILAPYIGSRNFNSN